MTGGLGEGRILAGFVIVMLLAIVGGQARFVKLQRALGIEQLLASGFLFVPLGMLLSEAGLRVMNRDVVRSLDALVTLGLGVLGLDLGLALEAGAVDRVRGAVVRAAAATSVVTLVLVGAPLVFLFEAFSQRVVGERLAAAALVGCIAAISSGVSFHTASRSATPSSVVRIAEAGTVAAVVAAGVLVAVFMPGRLGPAERLLALLATGAIGGVSAWLFAAGTPDRMLRTALLLGGVVVTAGTAAHVRLPPVAATLIAGLVLARLPGPHGRELRASIAFLVAPLTVLLLVIAGASLRAPTWPVLAVVAVFLLLRTAGRFLGGRLAASVAPGLVPPHLGLALLPSSAVALGLAVDFHTHMRGQLVDVVVATSVLGALLSETAGVWTTRVLARTLESPPVLPEAPP